MGGIGSDLAVKSSDMVLLNDDISSISDALKIAKKTKRIVYENIIFIMAIKLGFLALGAGAMIGMKEAIFADVGVALLAIFNSMRILKTVKKEPIEKKEEEDEELFKPSFSTQKQNSCNTGCCS